MDARCPIELLGGLRVLQGDRTVTRFRTEKTGALLGYLACFLDRRHPRETLIELLEHDDARTSDEAVGRVDGGASR